MDHTDLEFEKTLEETFFAFYDAEAKSFFCNFGINCLTVNTRIIPEAYIFRNYTRASNFMHEYKEKLSKYKIVEVTFVKTETFSFKEAIPNLER